MRSSGKETESEPKTKKMNNETKTNGLRCDQPYLVKNKYLD